MITVLFVCLISSKAKLTLLIQVITHCSPICEQEVSEEDINLHLDSHVIPTFQPSPITGLQSKLAFQPASGSQSTLAFQSSSSKRRLTDQSPKPATRSNKPRLSYSVSKPAPPLHERLRPRSLDECIRQFEIQSHSPCNKTKKIERRT